MISRIWHRLRRPAVAACLAVVLWPVPAHGAVRHQPQWLRALELRSDALNRRYHLGRYANPPAPRADRGFDWGAAAVGSGSTVFALASVAALTTAIRGRLFQAS